MAKKSKPQARKKAARDLAPRNARAVKGGGSEPVARKAGKGQQEYLIVKMNDILITGVQPTGGA